MRILYTISGFGEEHIGYEMHRELAQEIIARGHSYTIFALSHAKHMRGRESFQIEEGVPVYRAVSAGRKELDALNRLTEPIFKFPWFGASYWNILNHLRTHRDYDIVIAEGAYPFGGMIYLATRLVRVPFLVYVHGGDFIANQEANYGYARYRVARWLMRAAFQAARVVRAESLYGAEQAIQLGCPPAKMALIQRNIGLCCFLPPGADPEIYRRAARARIMQKFNITSPRLIVTVGRLLPIKGFDDLLRALPRVRAEVGDVHLLHLGPNRNDTKLGNYQKHLENLAQQLGVADRITFAGSVEYAEVRDFLAAADVVAVPSVQDSGNRVVMEAAAVATPFVATWTAGNAQWTPNWNCGLIVAPRAPEEMAVALSRVLSDVTTARQMGLNGLEFAEAFRPSIVAERVLELCDTALRRAPLPSQLKQPEGLLHPMRAA